MMMEDICFVGHITKDKIITPEGSAEMAGGTSYYCATALSSLPDDIRYNVVTIVGRESQPTIDDLLSRGIDVRTNYSPHSVFFENKYGENQNNRQQRVLYKSMPFDISMFDGIDAKVYHLGSLLADDFPLTMIENLAERGKISIDVQGFLRRVDGEKVVAVDWADKHSILPLTNTLKLNEHEMESITGLKDPYDVARLLSQWGVAEVVITLGSHGSIIYAGGQYYEIPAYKPRHVVDATGCGDTYSAGYLYFRSKGATYDEAGRMAAAMCTLKLQHNGPFCGSIDDIYDIIGSQKG